MTMGFWVWDSIIHIENPMITYNYQDKAASGQEKALNGVIACCNLEVTDIRSNSFLNSDHYPLPSYLLKQWEA